MPDHHECIKEWLLNHAECPFCRNIFLDVDRPDHQVAKSPQQLTKRAQLAYCCLVHGLVEISPLLCRRPDLMQAIETKVRGELTLIQKGDLIVKRGARHTFHEEKELTAEEASIFCLASHGDDSPSRKQVDERDGADLEANVPELTTTETERDDPAHQYLI